MKTLWNRLGADNFGRALSAMLALGVILALVVAVRGDADWLRLAAVCLLGLAFRLTFRREPASKD